MLRLLLLFIAYLLGHSFQTKTETHKSTINNIKNTILNADGDLVVSAYPSSTAFDFLLGNHEVRHKKLKMRLAGGLDWEEFSCTYEMKSILGGISNPEQYIMYPSEGIALRLFNPATRLWNADWTNRKSGILDVPVVGSFENKAGLFDAKDHYRNKPISVRFKWDATYPEIPVWSQAFSVDQGETWKRNWYVHFSKSSVENSNAGSEIDKSDSTIPIGVIELRNYVIKHGLRDSFIHYFEGNFIEPQEALQGYLLGQYRVKGSEDNFCWIRGFKDMRERSHFLPTFYYGPFWKQHKQVANSMLANNDNVYLLKPLLLHNDSLEPAKSIIHSRLIPKNGITIVEFYTANTKLDQLLQLFAKKYIPLLKECGISDCTLFTSMLEENDFPGLPVFQDKNLLVAISFYRNELSYEETMKKVASKITDDLRARLQDVITIKNTMILYPTEKTAAKIVLP